jgi:hypothetical protein
MAGNWSDIDHVVLGWMRRSCSHIHPSTADSHPNPTDRCAHSSPTNCGCNRNEC